MFFINLCSRGKLKEAQDLWITMKDRLSPIDIHAYPDYAFRSASQYLETAKWLVSLGGMQVSESHPLRRFYLDRFPRIVLLKVYVGRYLRGLRERLYSPGGRGYIAAKERFEHALSIE